MAAGVTERNKIITVTIKRRTLGQRVTNYRMINWARVLFGSGGTMWDGQRRAEKSRLTPGLEWEGWGIIAVLHRTFSEWFASKGWHRVKCVSVKCRPPTRAGIVERPKTNRGSGRPHSVLQCAPKQFMYIHIQPAVNVRNIYIHICWVLEKNNFFYFTILTTSSKVHRHENYLVCVQITFLAPICWPSADTPCFEREKVIAAELSCS